MAVNILLVDDELSVLAGLTRLLRKEPFQIITTDRADAALRVLQTMHIDLIISDQRMPGMTGTSFLTQAKEEQPDALRIMLTGSDLSAEVFPHIEEDQLFRILQKPCPNEVLLDAIREALACREKGVVDARGPLDEPIAPLHIQGTAFER